MGDKVARIRIQLDLEMTTDVLHFRQDAPDFEENVRFFYEENHCVENETMRALKLLQEYGERESEKARKRLGLSDACDVCVTCHGAKVTLLSIEDATADGAGD